MRCPALSLLLVLFVASALRAADAPQPPQFLILPLHIHILTAKDRPDIDCKLTDADIERIIKKANTVWSQAGIAFRVESLLREPAENIERFDEQKKSADKAALGIYRTLAPEATRGLPGLHVYYVHELPVNGVYLGGNICFVKETAALRKVEGGIDEPIPRVTSHELGHALSLPHRQDTFNLLASGTTGTLLNETEVTKARAAAGKLPGTMTPAECEAAAAAAETAGDKDLARRRRAARPAAAVDR